jgi:hypothetical protein
MALSHAVSEEHVDPSLDAPVPKSVVVPVAVAVSMFPVLVALAMARVRHHVALVPSVVDEVDRLTAGMVFVAMFVPMLPVTRRHPKIDALATSVAV